MLDLAAESLHLKASDSESEQMTTTASPANLAELEDRALAEYEKVFEPGKIVALADCKKLLRQAFTEQAALIDVPQFTRDNPEVFDLPNLSLTGTGGTVSEVVANCIATHSVRRMRNFATVRFIGQFADTLPEVLASLTDRSLAVLGRRPNEGDIAHEQFNKLSGIKVGLEAGLDLELAEAAVQTLVAFSEGELGFFNAEDASRLGKEIKELENLAKSGPGVLETLIPRKALTM